MKKYIFFIITALGLGILSSCEKDETQAVLSSNPSLQTIVVPTDIVLSRADANKTLVFSGKAVDFGFKAAVKYTLQGTLATDTEFANAFTIASAEVDTFKISVADLNSIFLLKGLTEDVMNDMIFRVKAYVSDAVISYSAISKAKVTPYGLPRLDLVSSDVVFTKITSSKGDGVYSGYIKLASAASFTLKDPDTGKNYGISGSKIADGGSAITVSNATTKDPNETAGWYYLTANKNDGTFSLDASMYGLIGSATPNQWNAPDIKMDYVTTDLVAGDIKFRLNNGWDWNLGGTQTSLTHNGSNITLAAGNYTIKLTITNNIAGKETGTYTIVKN